MNKIDLLRKRIGKENLDGYIIPTFDEFLSEYPAKRFKRLEYITDFSCSNGVFIIGIQAALFFTDSRYIDAAIEHFKNSDIKVFNFSELKNFDYAKYFKLNDQIGFDTRFFTKNFKNYFTRLNLVSCKDLIDDIWENKPDLNLQPIFEYENKFSGESRESKFLRVREFIKESGAESLILTSCESVCWLLNMRSFDAEFSPIILSYLYIDFDRVVVFTHSRDLPKPIDGIEFKNLNEFEEFANQISGKLIIPNDTSIYISEITKRAEIICKDDPCLIMRSQKNDTEILGAKNAHLQDAVALIEFLAWFYDEGCGKTEFELGLILTEFRSKQKSYLMDSFPPIVGFCENGAKIHYRATNNSKTVEGDGLLLIDSGGHYYGGTTDVTRTILVGNATEEWKKYYTLVLKGHIALARAKFPYNLCGGHLDVLARQYLWQNLEDYAHGTGHGVGNMLSVHEGRMRISLHDTKYILQKGMILSNEPGYYKSGGFGIRIENLQYVKNNAANQKFLEFEQLTLAPYCKDLILFDRLSREEVDYLHNYYRKIIDLIGNNLSKNAIDYLNKQMEI